MNVTALPKETARADARLPAHPVESVFIKRWSPRAFDAAAMPATDLETMLEAARWAPSAYNIQPWRFVYALRDDACWGSWLDLLDPANAAWAHKASALVFLASDSLVPARDSAPRKPSTTHRFDAGAAWAQLALQATAMGYQAHAMAGIRVEAVRRALDIPAHYQIEIGIAIGRPASPATLPPALRARETPSPRLPLERIAAAGRFPAGTADRPHPGVRS